jgi:hypothetical protein
MLVPQNSTPSAALFGPGVVGLDVADPVFMHVAAQQHRVGQAMPLQASRSGGCARPHSRPSRRSTASHPGRAGSRAGRTGSAGRHVPGGAAAPPARRPVQPVLLHGAQQGARGSSQARTVAGLTVLEPGRPSRCRPGGLGTGGHPAGTAWPAGRIAPGHRCAARRRWPGPPAPATSTLARRACARRRPGRPPHGGRQSQPRAARCCPVSVPA